MQFLSSLALIRDILLSNFKPYLKKRWEACPTHSIRNLYKKYFKHHQSSQTKYPEEEFKCVITLWRLICLPIFTFLLKALYIRLVTLLYSRWWSVRLRSQTPHNSSLICLMFCQLILNNGTEESGSCCHFCFKCTM